MNITAVIPAKGTSERLKNKNLLEINNKSLVYWACKKCLDSKLITHVYLDTESNEIKDSVSELFERGLKIIDRPKKLADNNTSGNDLVRFELSNIEPCHLFLHTYSTSPLITSRTIDDVVLKFLDSKNHDSFFSAIKYQNYLWVEDKHNNSFGNVNFDHRELPNSNDLNKFWEETHGLYGIYYEVAKKYGSRLGLNPMPIQIDTKESLDINYKEDYLYARTLWTNR